MHEINQFYICFNYPLDSTSEFVQSLDPSDIIFMQTFTLPA